MTNRCPECGATFAGDTLQGHCPRCLAAVALNVDSDGAQPSLSFPRSFGEYELLEEMGRGGMGVVYRARQKSLKREVAIKMILAGEFASAEFVRRFRHEATAAGSLQHPNIVAIHEVGEVEGQHYFSMDLVDGNSLAQLAAQQPLHAHRAARYVKAITEAIHYAHGKGILHRDLKPSNVLIDPFDQPRILDFGLAREFQSASELTQSGQTIGSPAYAAPEQGNDAGPASDVYSIGTILYHLLAARPPFQGATLHQVILQVQTAEPVAPRRLNPDVPEDLETICLKCLEKEPSRRYPSARELADDLDRFLKGEPVTARPVGAAGKVWRWCKREPAIASLTSFAVVLLIALAVGGSLAAWRIERALVAEHKEREKVVAAGARLAETVTFLELQRAEGFFQSGDASMGLAQLAAVLRRDPSNRVAAERILSALLHRNWVLPAGRALEHTQQLTSVAFTPDGEHVVTGCADMWVRIWNVSRRQETGHRLRHPQRVRGVCFSPDGGLVASACRDGKVRLWDWRNDRVVHEITAHEGWVLGVAISSDSTRLVTTSTDKTARIWNVESGELLATLAGHTRQVWQAAFSPDGKLIATASYDGSARLWNGVTGEPMGAPFRHNRSEPMLGVAFSPDGSLLATSSRDRTARVWSIESRTLALPVLEHPAGLNDVQFHPSGDLIVTTGFDNSVRLWDGRTGAVVSQPFRHREQCERAAFSPDGRLLATASDDGTVKFWEVRPGEAVKLTMAHSGEGPGVKVLALSANGKLIASGSHGIRLWDAGSGEALRSIDPGAPVQCAAFSRDGRFIAMGTTNGVATVWETHSGKKIAGPFVHSGTVWSIDFSVDARRLLTGSNDKHARVWDIDNPDAPGLCFSYQQAVAIVRYSPDGTRMLTASWDYTATIRDAATGAALATIAHTDALLDACFSRDGRLIATASQDNTARIWNAETGEPIGKPLQHLRSVESVGFSPDGLRVITGSLDQTARIWDSGTGEPLSPPLEHREAVVSVSFSPDGTRVLTTSRDSTARVWDTETGLPASDPLVHNGPVRIGHFTLDGESVITGALSPDNAARIWRVPSASGAIPEWLPDLAEAVAGLSLGVKGTTALVSDDQIERIKARLEKTEENDNFHRVARWFFADRGSRTMSPFDENEVR